MGRIIEAIYENGVLKPCGEIRLENKRKYKLVIGIGLERFFGIFCLLYTSPSPRD